ncbi:EamA family transporter RarD [Streptomyces sp. N2-109]|uniref:EamA family transporter RarD n=1 Tax=Streptomyces gossypii TaxID=2883101 RepID=A0ABT2JUV6_9ACTN|nr:EamA family transporter RarD [Streptomyces gossypii]MCT2591650.1 EamA family transporter RarD [Streptomyces gossypii]
MTTSRQGVLFGLGAYTLWGLFPLYFRLLESASALEILLHRLMWTLPLCVLVIAATGAVRRLRTVLRDRRRVASLAGAATVLAVNSGCYVYAVNSGHVIEAALGYFINPLVTVALAVLILRERLRPLQWTAVAMGALAVVVLTVDYGRPPWIALVLATSFALYGLIKKQVGGDVGAIVGLTTESLTLAPVAAGGLAVYVATGNGTFTDDAPWHAVLLAVGGVTVATPLLLFAAAARRLPLTTIGLLQYLTPILQLLIGVLLFHESMPASRWIGFVLIWTALTLLSADGLRRRSREKTAAVVPPVRSRLDQGVR